MPCGSILPSYADYALTDAFETGFVQLAEIAKRKRAAMMCAEAVWWRCHRRIIADYLIFAGDTVVHIFTRDKEERAKPTPAARSFEAGKVVYNLE